MENQMITIHNSDGTVENVTRAEGIKRGYKIDLTKAEIVALHNKAIRTLAQKDRGLVVPLKYDSTVADLSAQIADLDSTLKRAQAQIHANLQYQSRIEEDKRELQAEIARLEGGLKIADDKRETAAFRIDLLQRKRSAASEATAEIMEKRIVVLQSTIETMGSHISILKTRLSFAKESADEDRGSLYDGITGRKK